MSIEDVISERLDGAARAIVSLGALTPEIAAVCATIAARLRDGGTLYACGNGGSAAEAMHLTEELIGRYRGDRPALRAVCLNADPAALTCIANDFGYASVFARQCEALVTGRDVLVVLSTSGDSENLVRALRAARDRGATTIGLLGKKGGACLALCDLAIVVPADDSAHVQEAHLVLVHLVCEVIERGTAL